MTQLKFGRNYVLSIEAVKDKTLIIGLPFTLEFNITRMSLGSINSCQLRIYNLSAEKRELLRQDWSNYSQKRKIKLNAGYGDNLPLIFVGDITQSWSLREGVDFVTTIECQDGAYAAANSLIPNTANFPANTPMQTIYRTLMGYLANTSFGKIGDKFILDENKQIIVKPRSSSYTGDVIKVLNELSGNALFIDNGKTYILSNEEFLQVQGSLPVINSQSGLLNSPLLELQIVTFDMIFEPSLFVGQLIKLESLTIPQVNSAAINKKTNKINGNYKISSIKHKCVISTTVCGDAITTVEFYSVNSPLGSK